MKYQVSNGKFYSLATRAIAIGNGHGLFRVNNILDALVVSTHADFALLDAQQNKIANTRVALIKHGCEFIYQTELNQIFFVYMIPLSQDMELLQLNYPFNSQDNDSGISWLSHQDNTIIDYLVEIDQQDMSAQHANEQLSKLMNPGGYTVSAVNDDHRIKSLVCRMIEHTSWTPNAHEAASYVALSESRFRQLFKQQTGMSFADFKKICRHKAFNESFAQSGKLSQSSHQANYTDAAHFCRTFKYFHGLTPSQFYGSDEIKIYL